MKSRYRLSISGGAEDALRGADGIGQAVDVVEVVVNREAGTRRGRQVVPLHERLRAVMAGADSDPMPVQDLGEVVRMNAVHDEADDAGVLVGRFRAEPAQAADLPERSPRRLEEDPLVRPHR